MTIRDRLKELEGQGIDPMTARDMIRAEMRDKIRKAETINDLKEILLYTFEA